jgi:RNA polymerase sigma factor (sigma-70 family)
MTDELPAPLGHRPKPAFHSGDDDPGGEAWTRAVLRRYEMPLIQYAARITGCRERARDAVQDTFLRMGQLAPGALEGDPAKWLFTVCRNRALDICRKERRMTYLDHDPAEGEPSPDPGPAESLARKEAAGFLLKILEKLPPRQQEVIQLKFQNGLSYQEISDITQLSVSNVGFLLHRGLKALREQHSAFASQYVGLAGRAVQAAQVAAPSNLLPKSAAPSSL